MGTGTVALGWPFVTSVYGVACSSYIGLLLAVSCVLIGAGNAVNFVLCRRSEHGNDDIPGDGLQSQ